MERVRRENLLLDTIMRALLAACLRIPNLYGRRRNDRSFTRVTFASNEDL